MNRRQKREHLRRNSKRIHQLKNSKIINSERFKNVSDEEFALLNDGKHEDNELQDLFNKRKRLMSELALLIYK